MKKFFWNKLLLLDFHISIHYIQFYCILFLFLFPNWKWKFSLRKSIAFPYFSFLFHSTILFTRLKYILIVRKKQNLHERILLKGRMMKVEELKRWNTLQKCKLHRTPGMDLHRKWFLERCFWQQNFSQRGTCFFEQTRVLKSIRAIPLYTHSSFCFTQMYLKYDQSKNSNFIILQFLFFFIIIIIIIIVLYIYIFFQSKYTSTNYNRLLFFCGTI